jgi:hypothetical protein
MLFFSSTSKLKVLYFHRHINVLIFEIPTAVNIKIEVVWVMTPYSSKMVTNDSQSNLQVIPEDEEIVLFRTYHNILEDHILNNGTTY